MQRLGGIDSLFLNLETDAVPMHIAALMLLDPSGAPGFGFEAVRDTLAARLHLLPQFRRRVVIPPLNLIRPYWFEDPDFRIGRHVLRSRLPAPGNDAQLAEAVARILERRLDRNRPLWEFHYIDGLSGGRVACVAKIHHACVDGISGTELFDAVLDREPTPHSVSPAPDWEPDELPSPLTLAWVTARSALHAPRVLVHLARETYSFAREFGNSAAGSALPTVTDAGEPGRGKGKLLAPRTRFNATIDASRNYAFTRLPLEPLLRIKEQLRCSLNDVVLTLCGGALRDYLQAHDELPDEPLLAAIPMSVRSKSEYGVGGNRVIMSRVNLGTDIADPVARLKSISARMGRVKRVTRRLPAQLMMDWINMPAPALFSQATRLYENLSLQDYVSLPVNLVISNVPGPRQRLYFAGAPMAALYPVSIPYHGLALNITMMSYDTHLHVGLTANPTAVPDTATLPRRLQSALRSLQRQLKAAADAPPPAGAKRTIERAASAAKTSE